MQHSFKASFRQFLNLLFNKFMSSNFSSFSYRLSEKCIFKDLKYETQIRRLRVLMTVHELLAPIRYPGCS